MPPCPRLRGEPPKSKNLMVLLLLMVMMNHSDPEGRPAAASITLSLTGNCPAVPREGP